MYTHIIIDDEDNKILGSIITTLDKKNLQIQINAFKGICYVWKWSYEYTIEDFIHWLKQNWHNVLYYKQDIIWF